MGENIILALKVGVKPQKGREKPTKSRDKIVAVAQWTPAINEYHYRADTVCFRGELINVPAGKSFSCIIDMDGTLYRDMNHTMVIEYLP